MSGFSDWGDCLEPLLRDARFRAELIDRLEGDGERLVDAAIHGKELTADEQERLDEELRETYVFFAKQVVCLSWDSCSPMGGDGASWVVSFAGVYWFCSSDWENEGPCSSLGEALGCSSSFSMATHNATLKSDTMSAEELLPIAEDVCPHDGTIYVNGSDYRHGDDGLVLADDDDD